MDRSATLRWLVRAVCCLAVLVVVMHHVDRIGRTVVVLGAVVAAFFLATTIGLVQWLSGAEDLFQVVGPERNGLGTRDGGLAGGGTWCDLAEERRGGGARLTRRGPWRGCRESRAWVRWWVDLGATWR